MPNSIAFLRAINVGGNNKIAMADLRELVTKLGFSGATTWLQSGNLIFNGGRKSSSALETLLERETAKRFDVTIDYVIRSAAELAEVVAANPFPREAKADPSHLLVMFLKSGTSAEAVKDLRDSIKGPELVQGEGKQIYLVYPAGIGTSKLTGSILEKKLGTRGTARNWNTTLKLLDLASAPKA